MRTRIEKPNRLAKIKQGWQPTRRQIRLGLFAAGAVLAVIVALVAWGSLPHRLTANERVMIQQYDQVRAALADDDLAKARAAASSLLEVSRDDTRIQQAALTLSQAESLRAARVLFSRISSRVIKLVSGNDGYYRVGCSMPGGCPAECQPCDTIGFGDWIQTSPVVQNPFMGRAHPDCGTIK